MNSKNWALVLSMAVVGTSAATTAVADESKTGKGEASRTLASKEQLTAALKQRYERLDGIDAKKLTVDTDLRSLGANSVAIANVFLAVADANRITVPRDKLTLADAPTIRKQVDTLDALQRGTFR